MVRNLGAGGEEGMLAPVGEEFIPAGRMV
jgi:hypothetical protein